MELAMQGGSTERLEKDEWVEVMQLVAKLWLQDQSFIFN